MYLSFFFFKQKTAYEMRISDWSSDVCSSDLNGSSAPKPCALRQDPWLRSNGKYEPDDFVENPRSDAACPPCGASGGHRGLSGCDGAGSAAIDQPRAWPASEGRSTRFA